MQFTCFPLGKALSARKFHLSTNAILLSFLREMDSPPVAPPPCRAPALQVRRRLLRRKHNRFVRRAWEYACLSDSANYVYFFGVFGMPGAGSDVCSEGNSVMDAHEHARPQHNFSQLPLLQQSAITHNCCTIFAPTFCTISAPPPASRITSLSLGPRNNEHEHAHEHHFFS